MVVDFRWVYSYQELLFGQDTVLSDSYCQTTGDAVIVNPLDLIARVSFDFAVEY